MQDLFHRILPEAVLESRSIGGGDISQAYLVTTRSHQFFIKSNRGNQGFAMFEAEALGLSRLGAIRGVYTPQVVKTGLIDGSAFIIMDFIQPGDPKTQYWKNLAEALVHIHRTTRPKFGLNHNNFIGSLAQTNEDFDDWAGFYDHCRLRPQVQMAIDKKLLERRHLLYLEKLVKRIPEICPDEPPALVHGDLWAGNKICGANQRPYLIDPAISFAHREMDLAMAKLFGGFDPPFFEHYQQLFPLESDFGSRYTVYQLYYLLVHLNLFGRSYYPQVDTILKRYS